MDKMQTTGHVPSSSADGANQQDERSALLRRLDASDWALVNDVRNDAGAASTKHQKGELSPEMQAKLRAIDEMFVEKEFMAMERAEDEDEDEDEHEHEDEHEDAHDENRDDGGLRATEVDDDD